MSFKSGEKDRGMVDGESEDGDCEEVMRAGWDEPGGPWTRWGWRDEEESWFHR